MLATFCFLASLAAVSRPGPDSAYLAGVIALFATSATAFVAQFRVERPR